MSFFDIENPDSLPLSEPAPGVDILVTQCPCKEEVLVANGIQARCRKVETETEKQARLNCLREESEAGGNREEEVHSRPLQEGGRSTATSKAAYNHRRYLRSRSV
jgi:hypothetical protein